MPNYSSAIPNSFLTAIALFQECHPAESGAESGYSPSKFGVFLRKSKGFLRPNFFSVMTALFEYRATGCAAFPTMLVSEKIMKNFKRQLQPPQHDDLIKRIAGQRWPNDKNNNEARWPDNDWLIDEWLTSWPGMMIINNYNISWQMKRKVVGEQQMTNLLEQGNKRAWNWLESTAGRVVLCVSRFIFPSST